MDHTQDEKTYLSCIFFLNSVRIKLFFSSFPLWEVRGNSISICFVHVAVRVDVEEDFHFRKHPSASWESGFFFLLYNFKQIQFAFKPADASLNKLNASQLAFISSRGISSKIFHLLPLLFFGGLMFFCCPPVPPLLHQSSQGRGSPHAGSKWKLNDLSSPQGPTLLEIAAEARECLSHLARASNACH